MDAGSCAAPLRIAAPRLRLGWWAWLCAVLVFSRAFSFLRFSNTLHFLFLLVDDAKNVILFYCHLPLLILWLLLFLLLCLLFLSCCHCPSCCWLFVAAAVSAAIVLLILYCSLLWIIIKPHPSLLTSRSSRMNQY